MRRPRAHADISADLTHGGALLARRASRRSPRNGARRSQGLDHALGIRPWPPPYRSPQDQAPRLHPRCPRRTMRIWPESGPTDGDDLFADTPIGVASRIRWFHSLMRGSSLRFTGWSDEAGLGTGKRSAEQQEVENEGRSSSIAVRLRTGTAGDQKRPGSGRRGRYRHLTPGTRQRSHQKSQNVTRRA